MKYGSLHYPGDVTTTATPGSLLGYDELLRPFEVIDAEFDPAKNLTTVQLQSASPEAIRRALGGAVTE